QHQENQNEAKGYLDFADAQVERHPVLARRLILEAQDDHRQCFEDETPDHTKRIGLAQNYHVPHAEQYNRQLQTGNQDQQPIGSAILGMRFQEPVGQHTIFRDAIQHAVRANDGRVDGARKDHEADSHHKELEKQLEDGWAQNVPCQPGKQVTAVELHADFVGDHQHGKETDAGRQDETVNEYDKRRALEILELGRLDFTVNLRQCLFAAHCENGMSKCNEETEYANSTKEPECLKIAEESEGVLNLVDVPA